MTAEEFFTSLGSVLGIIGSWLWQLILWIFELLKLLFGHIAIAVSSWLSTLTLPMLPTILKIFSNDTLNLALFFILLLYVIGMNIAAFMMFGIDKKRSKVRKKYRISEKTLLRYCFWGGAGGGLLGMQVFKHKTQHKKFTISIPLMFLIQLVLFSVLFGFLGFWAFF